MPLSTEIFLMVMFIAGCPFFYFMLRGTNIQGRTYFMVSYGLLTLSNIFTVVEEFYLNALFNACEHLFITLGSITMFIAVIKLTGVNNHDRFSLIQSDSKD